MFYYLMAYFVFSIEKLLDGLTGVKWLFLGLSVGAGQLI
jgi:hypothetical protein